MEEAEKKKAPVSGEKAGAKKAVAAESGAVKLEEVKKKAPAKAKAVAEEAVTAKSGAEKAETVKKSAPVKAKAVAEEPVAAKVKEVKKEEVKAVKKADNLPKVKITLVKSTIGCLENQKRTVQALGLKKIRSFKIHSDTPALRGMIFTVKHLVTVEEVK